MKPPTEFHTIWLKNATVKITSVKFKLYFNEKDQTFAKEYIILQ